MLGFGLPAGFGCGSGMTPHYRYLQLAGQVENSLQDISLRQNVFDPIFYPIFYTWLGSCLNLKAKLWLAKRCKFSCQNCKPSESLTVFGFDRLLCSLGTLFGTVFCKACTVCKAPLEQGSQWPLHKIWKFHFCDCKHPCQHIIWIWIALTSNPKTFNQNI